ncbi:MAG: DUF6989 domain-containing protein [Spirochaetota bacterium]
MQADRGDFRLATALPWQFFFLVITAAVLWFRTPANIGIALLILCVVWNILFYLWSRKEASIQLKQILIFSMVLSIFQIFPDWVLSRHLNVLIFPPDGLFKWDTVSGYMALLWAIPTSTILVVYYAAKTRSNVKLAYAAALIVGALLFIGSEELVWMLPSWYAVNVVKWGHVARYIIVPELILTALIISVFARVREKSLLYYIFSALGVSATYTAAAVVFYFIAG